MPAGPGFPEVQRPAGSLGVESLRVDWNIKRKDLEARGRLDDDDDDDDDDE